MILYQTMDDMKRAIRCKYCGKPEFYGEFRWKDGKMMCRSCYRADYERVYGKPYEWDDLDGEVPEKDDEDDEKSH